MTLRHFRIFVAVCDSMSMTAAAETLFLSQPAVSQAVAELEKHYGTRLFERLARKLYLTQAGEKLLSYARAVIRINEEAEKDMRTLRESGAIRIGASVTVGAHVLPGLVSAFQCMNPETAVMVTEDNTRQIEQMILHDKTDIGAVEGELSSEEICSRPFLEDELVLVCGAGHRFASLPEIRPQELEAERFIVREPGSGTRKTFEDVMAVNELAWKPFWVCNNADTIRAAVAEGLGVSVISRRAVKKEVAAGMLRVVPIRGIRFKRSFKIIYHRNKYLTGAMKKFIDFAIASGKASAEAEKRSGKAIR